MNFDKKITIYKFTPLRGTLTHINRHLKTIAKEAGIDKTVTFHCARYCTFSYSLKMKNLQDLFFRQVTI